MSAFTNCGLVVKGPYGGSVKVPLVDVKMTAQVTGLCCDLTLTQRYRNTNTADIEAGYIFPIITGAAVHACVIAFADGKIVEAQIKSKEKAAAEYDAALKQGKTAVMAERDQYSDDVYSMQVGRLHPNEEITVTLLYAFVLKSLDANTLELRVPTAVAPRYSPNTGSGHSLMSEAAFGKTSYGLTFKGHFMHPDRHWKGATCKSHPVSMSFPDGPAGGLAVELANKDVWLDSDLVIELKLQEKVASDQMLSFSPTWQVKTGEQSSAIALYTHVDENVIQKLPPAALQRKTEFVFLVDASGSMHEDNRMEAARAVVHQFIGALPVDIQCKVQIIRFGAFFERLFADGAQLYSAETLQKAREFIDSTSANMNGTEILRPLRDILESPCESGYYKQVFVITDGGVTNTDQVISLAEKHAATCRIFTYGIGSGASTALVDGLARASSGSSSYVKSGDKELGEKVARDLAKALEPAIKIKSVRWSGEGFSEISGTPTKLPPVFAGQSLVLYALGTTVGTPSKVEAEIVLEADGITALAPIRATCALPLATQGMEGSVFALAARSLIRDLEDEHRNKQNAWDTNLAVQGSLNSRINQLAQKSAAEDRKKLQKEHEQELARLKERIVEISTRYRVLSGFTAFIGVTTAPGRTVGEMQHVQVPIQASVDFSETKSAMDRKRRGAPPPASFGAFSASAAGLTGSLGSSGPQPIPCSATLGAIPTSSGPVYAMNVGGAALSMQKGAPPPQPGLGGRGIRKSATTLKCLIEPASAIMAACSELPGSDGSAGEEDCDDEDSMDVDEPIDVNKLLKLQQFEGHWTFDAIIKVLGVELDAEAIRKLSGLTSWVGVAVSSNATATLIVLWYLFAKEQATRGIWTLNAHKALAALRKMGFDAAQLPADPSVKVDDSPLLTMVGKIVEPFF